MDAKTVGEMSGAEFNAYARSLGVVNMVVGQLAGKMRARAETEVFGVHFGVGATPTEAITEALERVRGALS